MSERIKNMLNGVVNTSDVADMLERVTEALTDLYNRTDHARARAIEVIDERSLRLGSLIADIEVCITFITD